MYIDTHCHLFKEDFNNIDEIIKKNKNNIIIVSSTNIDNMKEVIYLIDNYKNVYGTVGIHPDQANNFKEKDFLILESYLNHPKIVAVGEIGLDYYWFKNNTEKQKELFFKQLDIAHKYNKAVVIHSRESIEDVYNILKDKENLNLKAVLHCYTGDYEKAQKFTELGVMLGIGGIITFKNNNKLLEVIKNIDMKYLLLETDSPYLTPSPFRGKINEPSFIPYIANEIAKIKELYIEDVYKTTTSNAIRQFDLKLDL